MTCHAALKGLQAAGYSTSLVRERQYHSGVAGQLAVFYGLAGNLARILREYSDNPETRACYIDLGYWGRGSRERNNYGYHKITVNSRHPTAYFQRHPHNALRANKFTMKWRQPHAGGDYLLLAGMSAKAAAAEGYAYGEYEHNAVARIRAVTDLPIRYRAKPSCPDSGPIEGTIWTDKNSSLDALLAGARVVVSRHSNVALDALIAGRPVCVEHGPAVPLSTPYERLETPDVLDDTKRKQLIWDAAYCQWDLNEMIRGLPWLHLQKEGVI